MCKPRGLLESNILFSRLHQQFPAFSAGARLCKRWLSAHLLANHFTDEATELMVAHLFLCPAPHVPPGLVLQADYVVQKQESIHSLYGLECPSSSLKYRSGNVQ